MSGWTALTIHTEDDELAQEIDKLLRKEYTGKDPYTATGYGECTLQIGRHANHKMEAQRFAEAFPEADNIAIVSANDTSNSGNGTLFSVENGNAVEIDNKKGFEGADGLDVVGYFKDEHGVKSHASFEA